MHHQRSPSGTAASATDQFHSTLGRERRGTARLRIGRGPIASSRQTKLNMRFHLVSNSQRTDTVALCMPSGSLDIKMGQLK